MVNRVTSSNTSLAFNIVGIICILSFFVDFAILALGFSPTNQGAQIAFTTGVVDRGIVPMIGIVLILAGHWFSSAEQGGEHSGFDLRLPSLILSSLFGLMFLLIFPLHINNVRQASTERVTQISQQAEQAETRTNNQVTQLLNQLESDQAKAQLEQARNRLKTQLNELVKDEERYKQALANPNLPQTQRDILKRIKSSPAEIDKVVNEITDPNQRAQQTINNIRQQREEQQKNAKDAAWRSGLRTGISSLLLSLGYIIMGWTGLKGMGSLKGGKKKAPAR